MGRSDLAGKCVAVVGDGRCDEALSGMARELGERLGSHGLVIVCGGLGGVMRAACEGARGAAGRTIGILPGLDRNEANEFVDTPIATGLGHMRNYLVVLNSEIVVAVGGGYGTLSEIALALKIGRRVVALGRWATVDGVQAASTPEEAAAAVVSFLQFQRD